MLTIFVYLLPAVEPVVNESIHHKLEGAALDVAVYHGCLFDEHETCEPAICEIPAPVEVRNLDKYKLKFIRESCNEALFKDLESHYAKLNWPVSDECAVLLTCTLRNEMPDVTLLLDSWAVSAENVLLKYLNLLQVEEIGVDDEIWDDVVKEWDAKHIDGVQVFPVAELFTLVVVGLAAFVRHTAEEVKRAVKNIKEVFQKKNTEITETVNKIKLILLQLLLINDFPEQMMNKYPGMTVNIQTDKAVIVFQGNLSSIKNAKIEMYEMLQATKDYILPNLSKSQMKLVKRKGVQVYILRKLKSKNVLGAWEVSDNKVTVLTFLDTDPVQVAEVISEAVVENKQTLDVEAVTLLSSGRWNTFTMQLTSDYWDVLEIIYEPDHNGITVVATDDMIAHVTERIDEFILKNAVYTQNVIFPSGIHRFIVHHCQKEISQIMSNLEEFKIDIQCISPVDGFAVSATKTGMDLAIKDLQELASKIGQKIYVHKKPGVSKVLKSVRGSQFIAGLEARERCIIEFVDGQKREENISEGDMAAISGDEIPDDKNSSLQQDIKQGKTYL